MCMGQIKKLLDIDFVGGSDENKEVYPVTSTMAVYDSNNQNLNEIIRDIRVTINTSLARISKNSQAIFSLDDSLTALQGRVNEVQNEITTLEENITADIQSIPVPNRYNLGVLPYLTEGEDATFALTPEGSNTLVIPKAGDVLAYPGEGQMPQSTFLETNIQEGINNIVSLVFIFMNVLYKININTSTNKVIFVVTKNLYD